MQMTREMPGAGNVPLSGLPGFHLETAIRVKIQSTRLCGFMRELLTLSGTLLKPIRAATQIVLAFRDFLADGTDRVFVVRTRFVLARIGFGIGFRFL